MSASTINFNATTTWLDLVAANTSLADVYLTVQNITPCSTVQVVFGGNTAPSNSAGARINLNEGAEGANSHIWVRGLNSYVTVLVNE